MSWMNDDDSATCLRCNSEFTVFNRRHHCRCCGDLVCDSCSLKRALIPLRKLLSPPFSLILADASIPHRCCDKCYHMISPPEQQPISSPAPVVGLHRAQPRIPEIDCVGLKVGEPVKKYKATIPVALAPNRIFKVSLDGRIMAVKVPNELECGDGIIIRAPLPKTGIPSASAIAVAPVTKKEGILTCPQCTYDNSIEFPTCQVCGFSLENSFLTSRPPLPTTNVLELCPGDKAKSYYVNIPNGVQPDDSFQVLLDSNLWTILCPREAEGGDRIIVHAPDPIEVAKQLAQGGLRFLDFVNTNQQQEQEEPTSSTVAGGTELAHDEATAALLIESFHKSFEDIFTDDDDLNGVVPGAASLMGIGKNVAHSVVVAQQGGALSSRSLSTDEGAGRSVVRSLSSHSNGTSVSKSVSKSLSRSKSSDCGAPVDAMHVNIKSTSSYDSVIGRSTGEDQGTAEQGTAEQGTTEQGTTEQGSTELQNVRLQHPDYQLDPANIFVGATNGGNGTDSCGEVTQIPSPHQKQHTQQHTQQQQQQQEDSLENLDVSVNVSVSCTDEEEDCCDDDSDDGGERKADESLLFDSFSLS